MTLTHDQTHANQVKFRELGLPAFAGGQAADLITTLEALSGGHAHEANPILGQSPARISITKGAIDVLLGLMMDHTAKTHPNIANILGIAGGAVGAGLAVHNKGIK